MPGLFGPRLLPVGEEAPPFTVDDESGTPVSLSQFRGKQPVVLVFYPMDETPVCRSQLCEVRDHWEAFAEKGVAVLGVNSGSAPSHRKFKSKHSFPFPLLVDRGRKVASLYGAGGIYVKRCVYGIDRDGRICFAEAGKPSPETVLGAMEKT
jgi:peroxiredoxin Q/BCP